MKYYEVTFTKTVYVATENVEAAEEQAPWKLDGGEMTLDKIHEISAKEGRIILGEES